jgi:hypothetical protein
MFAVVGPKDPASCLDSTAGVRLGAPGKLAQIKSAQCRRYRIGVNVIDAEKSNRARAFSHNDHGARSDCGVVGLVREQPSGEGPLTPRRSVIDSQHERGESAGRGIRRDERGGRVVLLRPRCWWPR